MPTYDYYCPSNGRKIEVMHKMDHSVSTWGELCRLAEIAPGDTPAEAPVEKVYSFAAVTGSASPPAMPCGRSECAGGSCAFA